MRRRTCTGRTSASRPSCPSEATLPRGVRAQAYRGTWLIQPRNPIAARISVQRQLVSLCQRHHRLEATVQFAARRPVEKRCAPAARRSFVGQKAGACLGAAHPPPITAGQGKCIASSPLEQDGMWAERFLGVGETQSDWPRTASGGGPEGSDIHCPWRRSPTLKHRNNIGK